MQLLQPREGVAGRRRPLSPRRPAGAGRRVSGGAVCGGVSRRGSGRVLAVALPRRLEEAARGVGEAAPDEEARGVVLLVQAGGVAGPGGGPVASVHRLVPDLGGVGDEVARRGDTTSHGARAGPSQALCTRAFPKQKANRWSRSRRCCAERQTSQAKKPPEPRKSLTLSLVPTLAKLGRAGGAAVWLAPSPRCEVEERRVAGAAG